MRFPANLISPLLIRTSPEIERKVVLLPAPLAPMMVTMPSSGTAISMPFSAATLW